MGPGYNREFDQPVIFICGRRGSGKTTLARWLMERYRRAVVFDPKAQYEGEIFTSLLDLYLSLHKKVGRGDVRAVFRPDLTFGDDDQEAGANDKRVFNLFCEVVYSFGKEFGPVLFLCDEMDRFTGPGPKIPRWFDILVNEGRHAGVAMIGIARRPAKVPKDFIENAHEIYCFHMKGGALGYLASTLGAEDVARLPGLKPLTFLKWSESEDTRLFGVERKNKKVVISPI